MNIDFSRLEQLQEKGRETAPKRCFEATSDKNNADNTETLKTANNELVEHNKGEEPTGKGAENFKIVSHESLARCCQLKGEIAKGLRAGVPETALFLKAIEAISVLVGDERYYNHIKADLEAIHGEGLGLQIPLEWTLADVREELGKLETAAKRKDIKRETRTRIIGAIIEHENREKEIKQQIERGSQLTLDFG